MSPVSAVYREEIFLIVEAVRLLEDINERLGEAGAQCKELLTNAWDECKVCLESSCMNFYTTNCSQGFQSFASKVQGFFKEWSPSSLIFPNGEEKNLIESYDKEAVQLIQEENSFSQLVSEVSSLFNQSIGFFKNIHQEFDQSFQRYFMSDVNLPGPDTSITVLDNGPVRNYNFLDHWDLSGWVQSLCDFGQAVFEGVSAAVSTLFKDHSDHSKGYSAPLKGSVSPFGGVMPKPNSMPCKELQNSSGCLQFKERCQLCYDTLMKDCPDVLELHGKSGEAFKLVNLSEQQYEDLLLIVHRHAEDTSNLMSKMKERFGWVAGITNITLGSNNMFSIEKVSINRNSEFSTFNETVVEVNILTSPTFTVRVPGHLDLESPEFIQYVADKALQLYKKNF
ncbi:clusterin-like protein 1 isoform X2 [Ascaphus truei]|uniref:clusterin-like protein 1 isoform X2 n=1 Tax=Ascaphus truei TaxID=8439 RepID=UPI003F599D4F